MTDPKSKSLAVCWHREVRSQTSSNHVQMGYLEIYEDEPRIYVRVEDDHYDGTIEREQALALAHAIIAACRPAEPPGQCARCKGVGCSACAPPEHR